MKLKEDGTIVLKDLTRRDYLTRLCRSRRMIFQDFLRRMILQDCVCADCARRSYKTGRIKQDNLTRLRWLCKMVLQECKDRAR